LNGYTKTLVDTPQWSHRNALNPGLLFTGVISATVLIVFQQLLQTGSNAMAVAGLLH
jgi:hypothetical protein